MNGYINGFSLNGAAYPSWVVRAVVVAVAAASVTVAPTRITFATAFGDAAVSVTLTQTHTIQARATGTTDTSSFVQPRLIYAGASTAEATATGNGAVRRDVFAFAGGDATCTGEALTAQALGEVDATAASTVVLADAHIIHPGRSLVLCEATGDGTADVTRYPTVVAGLGSVQYTRGEASVQRSGESFYRHDGYVPLATAGAVGEVPQDRVQIIATFGSFQYADCTGTAGSFVIYSGRALGTGVNTPVQAVPSHIHRPTASGTADASGTATGTRNVLPMATAMADAAAQSPRGLIKHAARSVGSADVSVSATGLRTAFGSAIGTAGGESAGNVVYGVQHYMDGAGVGESTGSASATQNFKAATTGQVAEAVSVLAFAAKIRQGAVLDAVASALVGRATGFTNADVRAPDERLMIVPEEPRGMIVYLEERNMVVPA